MSFNKFRNNDKTVKTQPLISVITVVFNGAKTLEQTILSVINQSYKNVEFIIIDGGSTDGTLDIIRKYEHAIDYWVSEPDKGIYDAMNKGIFIASGDWINFMNGGDIFFEPGTIMQIFNRTIGNEKIIYGNVHIRYEDFTRIEVARSPRKLWSGMKFCHQSVFCNLQYHKSKLFNITNTVCADLEFFYSAYKNNAKFQHVDVVISSVQVGGLSESNRLRTLLGSKDAMLNCGASSIVGLYYVYKYIDVSFRDYLKKLLPASVIKKIIQLK
jgi:glycosyltransferase involved in cell wall biosynthesis